jgi:hypothetical protein
MDISEKLAALAKEMNEYVGKLPEHSRGRLDKIRNMCGYIENGGGRSFKIAQDDATMWWTVYLGNKTYSASSFEGAIDVAFNSEEEKF